MIWWERGGTHSKYLCMWKGNEWNFLDVILLIVNNYKLQNFFQCHSYRGDCLIYSINLGLLCNVNTFRVSYLREPSHKSLWMLLGIFVCTLDSLGFLSSNSLCGRNSFRSVLYFNGLWISISKFIILIQFASEPN